jgi:hypothetical protein
MSSAVAAIYFTNFGTIDNLELFMKSVENIHPILFLIVATLLEVCGDAIIRTSIYNHTGAMRGGLMLIGAFLLFGYGFSLNLAPVEFGKIVGLYIATLFIMWQVINYFAFGTTPTLPILLGGAMVVTGGLIITFWRA